MSDTPTAEGYPQHSPGDAVGKSKFRWYKTSYPFALVSFALFAQGNLVIGIVLAIIAFANRRSEDWYKHRWPWILIIPLAAICIANYLVLVLATANQDQVVPR
jgi:hypothetical protein